MKNIMEEKPKKKIEKNTKDKKIEAMLETLPNLPSQQFIIPNSQEIDFSRDSGHQISVMPYAVKSFKFNKRNLNEFAPAGVSARKSGYSDICKLYPNSEFLLHIQVKEGTEFTNLQMQFIEDVQNIPETPFFCVYEQSYKNSEKELDKQITDAKKKHSDKEIVPVIEVFTEFNVEKVKVMKAHGIHKCIVIYRNYIRHDENWKTLMGLLDVADIFRFVLGVTPRMRRKNKTTTLLAPLRFGANYVAHGLPWSGGKGSVYLLGTWTYGVTQNATYPSSRIQALNKANTLTTSIGNLTIQQIKTLLY